MRFVLACDLVVLGLLVCLGLGLLLIWYIMFYCCWCDCGLLEAVGYCLFAGVVLLVIVWLI